MADTEAQQSANEAITQLALKKVDEAINEILYGQNTPGGLNDFLITSPEMMKQWALMVIKSKWGIRNPPPWLICAHTGESYKLGRY